MGYKQNLLYKEKTWTADPTGKKRCAEAACAQSKTSS